jgi:hypothetical protein
MSLTLGDMLLSYNKGQGECCKDETIKILYFMWDIVSQPRRTGMQLENWQLAWRTSSDFSSY